jgi:putative spermidine/putrescine transport system permease protein
MFDRVVNASAWLVVLFILSPLVIIIGGSFTETNYVAFPPHGFTLRWYKQLMGRQISCSRSCSAPSLRLRAARSRCSWGRSRRSACIVTAFFGRPLLRGFLLSPLVLPTIVTGVALLQFYYLIDLDARRFSAADRSRADYRPYVIRTVGAGWSGSTRRSRRRRTAWGPGRCARCSR